MVCELYVHKNAKKEIKVIHIKNELFLEGCIENWQQRQFGEGGRKGWEWKGNTVHHIKQCVPLKL